MVKTIIKFVIFEYCIIVFFQQIRKNFIKPSIPSINRSRQRLSSYSYYRQYITVFPRKLKSKWSLEPRKDIKYDNSYINERFHEFVKKNIQKKT